VIFGVPAWLGWRVAVGAILVGIILSCLGLIVLSLSRQRRADVVLSTAVLKILPAPSLTPQVTGVQGGAEGTQTIPPSPVPGAISINAYVQVSDTGGAGLRLRTEPGLNGSVQLVASEAEVFIVKDGPRDSDGYTWWYLVGPFDQSRTGWAVANYLIVVQGP
jgi:hypothetical protein